VRPRTSAHRTAGGQFGMSQNKGNQYGRLRSGKGASTITQMMRGKSCK
jgi:hypothetical protein